MNKILLIDDDQDFLYVLREWFSEDGYQTRSLSQTDEVFDTIEEYRPDIILIDYLLTGINGGEICSQIKGSARFCHIPIAIISGYPKVFLSLGNYKCDLFIAKPVDLYALTDQVRELLSLKSADLE